MNAMIICGVAAMLRSLKQTATSLSAIINTLIAYSFAAGLRSLKHAATSLHAIIRYDNMRRCRNVAFIETCCDKLACYNKHFDRIQLRCMVAFIEACCDKLACYNFAMIICGVAVILVFMKRTAVSLSAIYI